MKIVVNQLTVSEILPSQLRPRNIIAFEYDGRIYKLHYCESAYVFVSLDDSETKLGSRRNDTIVGIVEEIVKDYSVTILMFESRLDFLEWALSRRSSMKYSQENFEKMYDILKCIKQTYLSNEYDSIVERSSAFYKIGSMVCHLLAEIEK